MDGNIYPRLITVILSGICLVNYVKLASIFGTGMTQLAHYIINFCLVTVLLTIVIKKFSEIKRIKPNPVITIAVLIYDYLFVSLILSGRYLNSIIIILYSIVILILINISVFFEISD